MTARQKASQWFPFLRSLIAQERTRSAFLNKAGQLLEDLKINELKFAHHFGEIEYPEEEQQHSRDFADAEYSLDSDF